MNKIELEKSFLKIKSAKRVTEKLLQKTSKVATYICEQMETLGLAEIMDGKYIINEKVTSNGSQPLFSLKVTDPIDLFEYSVRLDSIVVSSVRQSVFLNGEFKNVYYLPNRQDVLTFIHDIPAILAAIGECHEKDEFLLLDNLLEVIKTHQKVA